MSCRRGVPVRWRRSCPATRFGFWSWPIAPDEFVNLLAEEAARAFPMPDPGIPWPNGMAAARRPGFSPQAAGWLAAASIRFVAAEGLDHDEEAMAGPAQEILAQSW